MKKRNGKRQYRYINGAKGAISLFMAVLMTPFLTIALLLVETGRYNSMISLLDEVMGVSSVATLANYDDYLQERWGLLAVSQGIDVDDTFSSYMEKNSSVMGSKILLNETTAVGKYPLSDSDILKNQIMEYSKLNIPTKLAFEIGDLGKLVSNLEKKVKGLSQIENLLTSSVDVVDAGVTFAQSMEKLEEISEKLEKNRDEEYEGKYSDFATNVNTLIDNLNRKKTLETDISSLESQKTTLNAELAELKAVAAVTEGKSKEQIEKEKKAVEEKEEEISGVQDSIDTKNSELSSVTKKINSGYTSAETAQTAYADWLQVVIENLEDFKEAMDECESAVTDAVKGAADTVKNSMELARELEKKRVKVAEQEDALKKTQKQMEELKSKKDYDPTSDEYVNLQIQEVNQQVALQNLKDEIIGEEVGVGLATTGSDTIGAMNETYKEGSDKYDEATIVKAISDLKTQKTKVSNLNIRGLTYNSSKVTREGYKYAAITGFLSVQTLADMADHLTEKFKESSLEVVLDMIESVYDSVMGLSVFVENDLSAVIDTKYFDDNLGGLPGADATKDGVIAIFEELGNVLNGPAKILTAFGKCFSKPGWKSIKAFFQSIIDLLKSMINLVVEIVKFVLGVVENLVRLFLGYERLYLTSYCAYNLSCRTDYSESLEHTSFTNISGFSAGSDSFPTASGINVPVFGEIAVMISSLVQSMNGSGTDHTFYGAELEYVLFGSKSEVANQLYIFVVIYLIRLLVSYTSVQTNAEIQALATASTIGYPVVIALFTFLEPLVQTILLVNGKDQSIMPTTVYLAPSGMPTLLSDLVSLCRLDSVKQDQLKSKMMKVCKTDEGKYQAQLDSITSNKNYSAPKKASSYFDFSYRDHCYVWLLLSVKNDAMLARLMDVIQMETMQYYVSQGNTDLFDLRNSFTYLETKTKMEINQLVPSLLESGLFTVERKQYRGY